jgi:membrane-associated phospholipid phosphatase
VTVAPSPARTGRRSISAATIVTALGVLNFTFYLAAVELGDRHAPLDREAAAVAGDLARELPREVVARITDLGAFPTTAVLVALTAIGISVRGRAQTALGLLAGFLMLALTVQLVKLGVARLRPPGHDPSLAPGSFPSGHAAHSTAWTAAAAALSRTRRATPRRVLAIAIVAGGVLVTLVVGATRLLLTAHYWSDVVGGWGLGAAVCGRRERRRPHAPH